MTDWDGTVTVMALDERADLSAPEVQRAALETVEGGGLVLLPGVGFELTAAERDMLAHARTRLGIAEKKTPNGRPTILFDPARGSFLRRPVRGPASGDLRAMLDRFAAWAQERVEELLPRYGSALAPSRITYRPRPRGITQSLHVDAAYDNPSLGRGMLRLFCNVDPSGEPRVWRVGEPFEPFARRFLPEVEVGDARPRWSPTLPWRRASRSTEYDRVLAELRRVGKRNGPYQRSVPQKLLRFPSGSSWLALADLALHGAVSGQHSIDRTFFLPAEAMRDPSRSSLRILERLTGRPLV